MASDIVPFIKDQDYESLLKNHNENNLFEDEQFPAVDSSLYHSRKPPSGIVWRRPKVNYNHFLIDN